MGIESSKKCAGEKHIIFLEKIDYEPIPLFDGLKLVLVGCNDTLKNAVGNALLGQSTFTFWTTRGTKNVVRQADTLNRNISLIRTPTWSGDLSESKRQKKIREEIVGSVETLFQGTGPHAVLLVVDVSSTITEVTRKTLESILTERVWNHTIVVFANVEKLRYGVAEYIRAEGLQEFIEQCGGRMYALQTKALAKQSREMIQMLEEMIAGKTDLYFHSSAGADASTVLVEKLQIRIHSLMMCKNLLEFRLTEDNLHLREAIESKEREIFRLREILHQRFGEIEDSQFCLSNQSEENRRLRQKLEERDKETEVLRKEMEQKLRERDQEILRLREGIPELQKELMAKDDEIHQLKKETPDTEKTCVTDSRRSLKRTLLDILESLSEPEFKKFKFFMPVLILHPSNRQLIDSDIVDTAEFMIKVWPGEQCLQETKNLLKDIKRNDLVEYLNQCL